MKVLEQGDRKKLKIMGIKNQLISREAGVENFTLQPGFNIQVTDQIKIKTILLLLMFGVSSTFHLLYKNQEEQKKF